MKEVGKGQIFLAFCNFPGEEVGSLPVQAGPDNLGYLFLGVDTLKQPIIRFSPIILLLKLAAPAGHCLDILPRQAIQEHDFRHRSVVDCLYGLPVEKEF